LKVSEKFTGHVMFPLCHTSTAEGLWWMVTSSVVQCGECTFSTFNTFPREDSSLALEGISQGLHELQGPLDAEFYAALPLGH